MHSDQQCSSASKEWSKAVHMIAAVAEPKPNWFLSLMNPIAQQWRKVIEVVLLIWLTTMPNCDDHYFLCDFGFAILIKTTNGDNHRKRRHDFIVVTTQLSHQCFVNSYVLDIHMQDCEEQSSSNNNIWINFCRLSLATLAETLDLNLTET